MSNKSIKVLVAATIAVACLAWGFILGRAYEDKYFGSKYYEDACHMSDLIRCYEDHLKEDSIIEDYGCFTDLEDLFLHDDCVAKTPVNLADYAWCY